DLLGDELVEHLGAQHLLGWQRDALRAQAPADLGHQRVQITLQDDAVVDHRDDAIEQLSLMGQIGRLARAERPTGQGRAEQAGSEQTAGSSGSQAAKGPRSRWHGCSYGEIGIRAVDGAEAAGFAVGRRPGASGKYPRIDCCRKVSTWSPTLDSPVSSTCTCTPLSRSPVRVASELWYSTRIAQQALRY